MKKTKNITSKGKKSRSAFTLVELIVVITILAILGVIWFISLNSYNTYARDSLRLSNIRTAISWLEIQYTQWWYYALPDNAVEVWSWTSIVMKQWTIWKKVERTIKASSWIWLDPVTQQEYTYATNTNLTKFQILAFFEWDTSMSSSPLWKGIIGEFSQAEDITKIRTFWKEIWVLTTESWTPIEKDSTIQSAWKLDLATDTTNYTAHFSDSDSQTFSGSVMNDLIVYKNQNQTNWCPAWFIKVPWNSEFNTTDFCVAKYEMSYIDSDTPNSCDTQYPSACTWNYDWNTVRYNPTKTSVSISWKYPITNIKQWEAIEACQKIWWHLITNNEWMTVARNIELEPENWKTKVDGVTKYLMNWVSNNEELGCKKTGWNTETRTRATKTWSPCDWWKNKLKLSNGEYIYDLSWNVWEHVNKANTIDWSDFNLWQTSIAWSSNGANWDDDWVYDSVDMLKYGSKKLLWKNNWMWNLYYWNWRSSNIFLRGGNASSGSHAGVFTLHLTRTSGDQDRNVGFRCVK